MRVLVLSDIHGNLPALEAVLLAAGAVDTVWNLGDIVGYGANPNEVIDRIRPLSAITVRGNHDRVCCGLTSAHGFNPVAAQAATWTRRQLTPENLDWLRKLPQGPITDGERALCAHGSPLHEDQYIVTMRDAWSPLQRMGRDITFFGHTHVQGGFAQCAHDWQENRPHYATGNEAEEWLLEVPEGTRHLINPGSVGQPRDTDWRAAFAIYDTTARTVLFHRIPYDVRAAQAAIRAAGLPDRLATRLNDGR
jgi:diadenosine tetraphosphatase ApaH/serine/threonine PP2A family protein phosphatase